MRTIVGAALLIIAAVMGLRYAETHATTIVDRIEGQQETVSPAVPTTLVENYDYGNDGVMSEDECADLLGRYALVSTDCGDFSRIADVACSFIINGSTDGEAIVYNIQHESGLPMDNSTSVVRESANKVCSGLTEGIL